MPPARTAATDVRIFGAGEAPPSNLVRIGKVTSYACTTTVIDAAAVRRQAGMVARHKAADLGAQAITGFRCIVAEATEKCPECWVCAQCDGTADRWQ